MQKFRKKPVVINAEQFNEFDQVVDGVCNSCWEMYNIPHIHTLEGMMKITKGDWIIHGVNNEVYPCKPDVFEKTYEKVEDENT